jgi:hypothetical protein
MFFFRISFERDSFEYESLLLAAIDHHLNESVP